MMCFKEIIVPMYHEIYICYNKCLEDKEVAKKLADRKFHWGRFCIKLNTNPKNTYHFLYTK